MRATVLLWRASFENRVFRQLRRLKQPRYLIATLIGLFYFWSVLLRWLRPRGDGYGLDPRVVPVAEAGLIVLALVVILSAWLFGSNRAQLEFSEAEIQFLFPAPVSRTALLWFKVLKSLLRVLLSALLSAFFVGGVLNSSRGIFFVGAWLGMSTLALHATGASLTRESLTQHGRFGLLRRPITILVAVLMLAGLVLGTLKLSPPLPATTEGPPMDALVSWLSALTNQAPLSWVLFPIRAPIRVALAQSPAEMLAALPAAAVVLAVHAFWVVSSKVAFEEAAVEAAEANARRLEERRAGEGRAAISARARRFRLPLSAHGVPAAALVWKNVIAARRTALGFMVVLGLLFATFAVTFGGALLKGVTNAAPVSALFSLGCLGAVAFLTVLGPSLLRTDFRQDLPQMDILRALPLSPVEVVRAELLGPGLLLALGQWVLLAFAWGASAPFELEGFGLGERAAAALGLALVAPMFSLAGLAVQNAAVLLLPGWVVLDRSQQRGFEAMGQRLLTTAGTLLVLGLGVVPAALAGGLVLLVLGGLGYYALPFVGVAAAAVIGAELWVATLLMGQLFARFDVSE